MAKHVLSELDSRTLVKSPTKFAKRSRTDDEETASLTETHLTATKFPRDAAVAYVPQKISHQPRTNNVVTPSEMMAYFSLLGTVKLSL